jgi:hypothetical protein
MPQSRQEINKRYREKHREKRAEYNKQYREKNKKAIAKYSKEYKENNKESIKERNKKYRVTNKEVIAKQKKEYNQTEKGKKIHRISIWKNAGIIDEDLSAVYDYLIEQTHCMICPKKYNNLSDKCLDHDHQTGEIRYICCRNCNGIILAEKYIT